MLHAGDLPFGGEAASPFYRKIALNGRPMCDTEPYLHKRSDIEAEKSCVDGLTLRLRHQTTDIYVPLVGGDFTLEVRRNHLATAWFGGCGLTARERPDLPFGNCWSSGIAANVHVIDGGGDRPVYVLVTDEQGSRHGFVEFFEKGGHAGYYPLPNCDNEQDGRAMSLVRRDNRLEFRRKYGTTLFFDFTAPAITLSAPGRTSAESHLYYRVTRAQDRRGGSLDHHFEPDNHGLVPDAISFVDRRMTIHRNAQGQVEKIVDLRGFEHRYEYRPPAVPGGAPLLVRQYRPAVQGVLVPAMYEYDEVSRDTGDGRSEQHAAISLIADQLGNTYRFQYRHDFLAEKDNLPPEDRHPVRLREVTLPDNAVTKFHPYAARESSPPSRLTFVSDAERHGRLYEFTGREIVVLKDLPWWRSGPAGLPENAPRFSVWLGHRITHYQGDRHAFDALKGKIRPAFLTRTLLRERYEFDLGAGAALARAFDTEGHVTTFTCADKLDRPHVPKGFVDPFAERHRDVTESRNPLGGIKRFAYHAGTRAFVRKEDELGHLTVFEVDGRTGLPTSETVYTDSKAEKEGVAFARTEFEYGNASFPGFMTRKAVRKIKTAAESPSWEVDLVRIYEADAHGNSCKVVADPEGRAFTWIYRHDENRNITSKLFPDGYYIQYRYDPCNRLDRIYRSRGLVEKAWYDGRGNKIKEIETDGEVALSQFDPLNRLVRRTVETGPADKREKKVSVYRYNAVNSKVYESEPGKPVMQWKLDGLQRVTLLREGRPYTRYTYSPNGCCSLFKASRLSCSGFDSRRTSRGFCSYDGMQNRLRQWAGLFRWFSFFSGTTQFEYRYDIAGNRLMERNAKGTTRFEYDALNRVVATYHPNGSWTRTLRTSTGLEYGTADNTGHRTEKRFDSAGEEVS